MNFGAPIIYPVAALTNWSLWEGVMCFLLFYELKFLILFRWRSEGLHNKVSLMPLCIWTGALNWQFAPTKHVWEQIVHVNYLLGEVLRMFEW